ncbi:MAG: two-component system response regulator [Fibrobacteres bacterium]|nr:two-component system response regulator [Fibrobacterota bacterium]
MQRALKSADIENPLQVLRTGHEAIEYLSGQGRFSDRVKYPLPFLLLLDLKLPDISGFEILKWVKDFEKMHKLATIVLTTSGESKDIEKAYEFGANSFLTKPSGSDKLLNLVMALKQYWFVHNDFSGIAQ